MNPFNTPHRQNVAALIGEGFFDYDRSDDFDEESDTFVGDYNTNTVTIFCNDFFWWGTADCEEVTEADLPMLVKAVDDVKAIIGTAKHAEELFICRKRNLRPQGACYSYIDERLWPLFNEMPEREIGIGNPCLNDGSYGKK